MSRSLVSSKASARWRRRSWTDALRASLHLLVWIHPPQPLLRDEAIEALALETAPVAGAALHHAEHAGLQLRGECTLLVGLVAQRNEIVLRLRGHHAHP